jgi:hypothetical protein
MILQSVVKEISSAHSAHSAHIHLHLTPRALASLFILVCVIGYLTIVARWQLTHGAYLVSIAFLILAIVLAAVPTSFSTTIETFYGDFDGITHAFNELAAVPMTMKDIIVNSLDNFANALKPRANLQKEEEEDRKASTEQTAKDSEPEDDGKSFEVEMSYKLYEDDPSMHGPDAASAEDGYENTNTDNNDNDDADADATTTRQVSRVSKSKYAQMLQEYAYIHYMLCSLHAVDPELYKGFFRAVLGRDPAVEPEPEPEDPDKKNDSSSNNDNNDNSNQNEGDQQTPDQQQDF